MLYQIAVDLQSQGSMHALSVQAEELKQALADLAKLKLQTQAART